VFVNYIVSSHSIQLEWLLRYLIPCPFKKLTGIDCPGCGFQRSVIALLQGDIMQSFAYYPATLLLLSSLLYIALNNKFRFKNYDMVKKWLLLTLALVITSSYLIKLINLHILY
jgi:heme/copper-type cytochrome/quinol oxidase subunit 3